MALPRGKPWPTELKYYWTLSIPPAVGNVVPGWSTMLPKILQGWNEGRSITYFDGAYTYTLNAVTSSELRFLGRFAFNYPSATKTRFYYVSIDRSTGAVTKLTKDFTTS